jgi:hypothetical protein
MTDLSALIAAATQEQQLALRFEAIFMPEVRRQRNTFYANNPNPRFVHYTRAEAALEIIKNKRLWLRNATAMVDFREVEHGFDLLSNWFNTGDNRTRFITVFDEIHPGAAIEAMKKFDEMWQRSDFGVRGHTYIASVSEHHPSEDNYGRLSMWRAFGADAAARVAFVFKVPPLSGAAHFLQCIFSPVAYLNEERARQIIEEVLTNAIQEREFLRAARHDQIVTHIYFMFALAAICVKHEGFKEEQEWRIVYLPNLFPPPNPPLLVRDVVAVGGVPQPIYKLPLDASIASEIASLDLAEMFDRLIIGPTRFPFVISEAFKNALEEIGVADPGSRVVASTIPIRS